MAMVTSSQAEQDVQASQWKQLVEEGNEAFEKERYAVAEVKFKEALELAEKLVEESAQQPKKKSRVKRSAAKPKEDAGDALTPRIRLSKSLNNLAALYHVQGKYGMAEELYERCLDLKLDIYGDEHLEVAVNLHNLAVLHSAKRTFLKAELLYKRTLEIREKLLGETHKDLAPVLRNYALLLKKTNRKEEGSKVDERASAIEAAQSSATE